MALEGLHYASSVRLWRLNGVGTTLIGRLDHRQSSPWYYKQFAFTIFFVPVYLGRFYAVQRAKKFRGWKVAGWLSDAEMAARVGKRAYWWFKTQALLAPCLMLIFFAALFAFAIWSDEHPPRV
jgi:hypothetical protein